MTSQKQRLFDLAWNGLKSQGFERSMAGGGCQYRGDNGRRCAIGWAIPDENYKPEMEGCAISYSPDIDDNGDVDIPGFGRVGVNFADGLQAAHDNSRDPERMESRLREVAKKHKLTIPGEGV